MPDTLPAQDYGCSSCGEGSFPAEDRYCKSCKRHFKRLHSIKGLDASEPVWLRHCRMIIKEGYAGVPITENGKTRIVSVDHYSASAVVNVYDALKPENKVLFVSKGFMVALKMSWKLIK